MRFALVGCALLVSCHCDLIDGPPSVDPPPPTQARLSPDFVASLQRNDAGLPIIFQSEGQVVPGYGIAFEFDESLDDPVVRWSECITRVTDCYQVNGRAPVSPCIAKLERCADATGGNGCCPAACFAAFDAAKASGLSEDDAVQASFIHGACVVGLFEQLYDAGVSP